MTYSFVDRGCPGLAAACMTAILVGCGDPTESRRHPAPSIAELPASEVVQKELDGALEATFQRKLSLRQHAAWQILHGALAYGREFLVDRDGELVSAVDHLLASGQIKGWTVEPGERGLRARLEAGSKTGQGHADQWLAILAQCNLTPEQTIQVAGRTYTMRDYVSQVQWDIPRNVQREYSWTLIGLTTYLPADADWQAVDGQTWSIERLMEMELDQDLSASACGGTHRLIGLTMSLNRHLQQGGQIEGVWQRADQVIQDAIGKARKLQNPDGSFSTNYLERPGRSPDLAKNLGTTGHLLEFLTLAMNDTQIKEPWVTRAALNLCDVFRKTRDIPLECGALYHAAHGLVLYRTRFFGARRYAVPGNDSTVEAEVIRIAPD
ncbi:MAG: ADP-ribosylation factor-directed GTPase activating protein isoform b [Pirellulaceae bacterium]